MTKGWLIALVLAAGCKKEEPAAPPPSPPPSPLTTTPPTTTTAGDPAAATPPAPDADTAGSARSADAAGSGAGSAAALSPEAREALCVKVLGKVYACRDDDAFAAALTAGASADDSKRIRGFIAAIKDWPRNFCTYEYNYEYPGFSEHWEKLTAPEILDSCDKLGTAIAGAGGLFGGDVAK